MKRWEFCLSCLLILDVICQSDYIIDLGPEGGFRGGNIIATGTPEDVANVKESYTGQFIKGQLGL